MCPWPLATYLKKPQLLLSCSFVHYCPYTSRYTFSSHISLSHFSEVTLQFKRHGWRESLSQLFLVRSDDELLVRVIATMPMDKWTGRMFYSCMVASKFNQAQPRVYTAHNTRDLDADSSGVSLHEFKCQKLDFVTCQTKMCQARTMCVRLALPNPKG